MIDPTALSIGLLRSRARIRGRREFVPQEIRSVGLIELTRLGDVLSALPAIRVLQRELGTATLSLFAAKHWASLVAELQPDIEVFGIEASDSVPGLLRASSRARQLNLDLSISLSPANRNALLCLSSGSPMMAGYLGYANTLTPFLGHYPIEAFGTKLAQNVSYARENIYRRAAKILEALGLSVSDLELDPSDQRTKPFGQATAISEGAYVVLQPFAGWDPRNWPIESFAELAQVIVREMALRVVFVSAPEDENRVGSLQERFSSESSVRFFSSGDLVQVAGAVAGASAYVGNDSGPLHLAVSMGVPVVGLYGAAPPELTSPPGARGSTLYHKVECSPCDQRFCRMPENSCMTRISVGEVRETLETVLKTAETHADG